MISVPSKNRVAAVVVALVMGWSAAAGYAQPRPDDGPDRGPQERAQSQAPKQSAPRAHHDRAPSGGPPTGESMARGAGPDHAFHKGERLPAEFRNHQYVVNDWRAHNLSRPPKGHRWVQTGGDYVLVAIASGLIAQIILGH